MSKNDIIKFFIAGLIFIFLSGYLFIYVSYPDKIIKHWTKEELIELIKEVKCDK